MEDLFKLYCYKKHWEYVNFGNKKKERVRENHNKREKGLLIQERKKGEVASRLDFFFLSPRIIRHAIFTLQQRQERARIQKRTVRGKRGWGEKKVLHPVHSKREIQVQEKVLQERRRERENVSIMQKKEQENKDIHTVPIEQATVMFGWVLTNKWPCVYISVCEVCAARV